MIRPRGDPSRPVCHIGIPVVTERRAEPTYVRGDEAARRHISGTALGLNIVRTIVVAHGGEVSVDSTPGEGSAFHVMLPRGG